MGEEATFKADPKIPTADHKAAEDHEPPGFGMLDAANINSPAALRGPNPGVFNRIVYGDSVSLYSGKRKLLVVSDEIHEVMGDQTEVIHGRTSVTNLQVRDVAVGVMDRLAVKGYQELYVSGESEYTYSDKHEAHIPWEFEHKLDEESLTGLKFEAAGGVVDVVGREMGYAISKIENNVFEAKEYVLREEAGGHKGEGHALTDKAGASADLNPKANGGLELGPGHIP